MTDEAYRLTLAPAARRVLTEGPPVRLRPDRTSDAGQR